MGIMIFMLKSQRRTFRWPNNLRARLYIVNIRVWHVHMYTSTLHIVQCISITVCTMYNVYCILYNVYIKSSSTRLPIESRDFKIQSSIANCT